MRTMMPRKSIYMGSTAARGGNAAGQQHGSTATTPGRSQQASQSAPRPPAPLMTVAVRIRPLSHKEMMNGHKPVVFAEGPSTASIAKLERMGAVLQSEKGQMHSYEFDHVFSDESTNSEVYEQTAKKLVPKVLDGMNCTIFAYGATGAGKTYSIMGNGNDPGMMPLSMIDLFEAISVSDEPESYVVKVSYMEVYCETIRDLLSESDRPLNPCEHPTDGTVKVLGLTEREVRDVGEVLELVREGSGRRKTEPTAANEFSSRSHAVLQVTVQKLLDPASSAAAMASIAAQQAKSMLMTGRRNSGRVTVMAVPEPAIVRQGRLSLIDLAGSERAAATLNTGTRLREGANINKSLLALANCINALSSGSERVKYRDSKLTHLLKSSLEGDCFVAMLAAVTPSHKSYEESHNTLKYAHRAKSIKANVPVPVPVAAPALTPSKIDFASRVQQKLMPTSPPEPTASSSSSSPSSYGMPPPMTIMHHSGQTRQLLATVDENMPSSANKLNPNKAVNFACSPKRLSIVQERANLQPERLPYQEKQQEWLPYQEKQQERFPYQERPVSSADTSRLEQALLAVKQERDRIAEERDELRSELQKAREAIASLKRASASSTISNASSVAFQAPPIPSKPRPSAAHLYYSQAHQRTAEAGAYSHYARSSVHVPSTMGKHRGIVNKV